MAERKNGIKSFLERFGTEEACEKHLFSLRFPNGFVCPKCGCVGEYYTLPKRKLYQCKDCGRQTSVTAGTAMHRSHLPLTIWFFAMYLVSKDKRGYSAKQLSNEQDLPYGTAWYLLQRIRSAMGERDSKHLLSGVVELDDTYYGKTKKGGKRGRGTSKSKIVVAVSKTEKGKPKFLKMKVAPNLKSRTISSFVKSSIAEGSKVETDAYSSYRKPLESQYLHKYEVFDADSDLLHWLHTMIGNMKAFVNGTFHGLGKKHLQKYLDEFCYRFNRRFFKTGIFDRLAIAMMNSSPITLSELS